MYLDDITVIVLVKNEELHLERCLLNVFSLTKNIVVIDSDSDDATKEICLRFGAFYLNNSWPGSHSEQLKWGLNNANISTEWVLRIDADEYLSELLIAEIKSKLSSGSCLQDGFYLKRKNVFMGRILVHGGMKHTPILRLWRRNNGYVDGNLMDEKIIIPSNRTEVLSNYFFDHNLSPIQDWIKKHVVYAEKEAEQYLSGTYSKSSFEYDKKKKKYYEQPVVLRPILYFLYRYLFKLGFLDRKAGLVWALFHGLWYRMLVDLIIMQRMEKNSDK